MKYIITFLLAFIWMFSIANNDLPGKQLFKKNCKACHNIDRKLVGPALKGIEERRDSAWIYNFILGSNAMIEAGDSIAVALFNEFNKVQMPNQDVSNEEIGLILDYIKQADQIPANAPPFSRPEVTYAHNYTPLQFSEFLFWVPFTIFVLILIGALYYQVFMYDVILGREKMREIGLEDKE